MYGHHLEAGCQYAPWILVLAMHRKLLAKLVTSIFEDTVIKIVFESACS